MALDIFEKHKTWINDYLIPNLCEQQKLIQCKNPNQHTRIKSVDITQMSMENTFMLTFCYFAKVSIEIRREHGQCEDSKNLSDYREFDLVIKVRSFYYFEIL